jgi:ATP-dependent Clp protease ATP-binding subunit ClpC
MCSDRFLPDKAIDLIDEAGSRVRLSRWGMHRYYQWIHQIPKRFSCIILIYALLMFQLPDEAKELRQITKQKNEAVHGQDFEKVFSDPKF